VAAGGRHRLPVGRFGVRDGIRRGRVHSQRHARILLTFVLSPLIERIVPFSITIWQAENASVRVIPNRGNRGSRCPTGVHFDQYIDMMR
jgi:hypothetical protein